MIHPVHLCGGSSASWSKDGPVTSTGKKIPSSSDAICVSSAAGEKRGSFIQAAMGWTDTHLYEFRVGEAGWGVPDPDGFYDGAMDAKKMTLEKLLDQTATRTIQYVYDFGDDWDHSIRIERVGEAAPGMTYPRLLKASGACPPEDVGGAWGYEEFHEALADPDHEQHADMVHWSGGNFYAEDAGIDSIIERFGRLSKKWAPRPRKTKPTI